MVIIAKPLRRPPPALMVLGGLLIRCNFFDELMPQIGLYRTLDNLPHPDGTVLIDETAEPWGSCLDIHDQGVAAYQIYGTPHPCDCVLAFYEARLTADGWHREQHSSLPSWTSPTKYSTVSITYCDDHFHLSQLADGAGQDFPTLYWLRLDYVSDEEYRRWHWPSPLRE
jgi:hypothetical protein